MELRLDLQHKRFDTAPIARLFTQGENNIDVITLRGVKMYGALDASQLTFILRAVSEKDTLAEQQLTAETNGDDLVLTWTVTEDFTAVSGLLHLKLRGIDTAGNVVLKLGAEPIYIQADIQGDYAPPQDVLTKALDDMRGQVAAAEEQAGIAKTEADRLVQAGVNFKVLGFYSTLVELQTAVPNPVRGDAYGVGDNPVHVYVWSGTEWQQGQALGIDLTSYYTKTEGDNIINNPPSWYIQSNPNLFINGDFSIWQRGNSFINTLTINYTADRWMGGGNLYRTTEKTDNGMKLTATSSGKFLGIQQQVEMSREFVNAIQNGFLTLSYCIKTSQPSKGYQGNNISTDYTVQTLTVRVADHYTAILQQGYYKAEIGIHSLADGSDIPVGFSCDIQWVKLELGDHATPFTPRLIGEELALCQRDYEIIRDVYCGVGTTFFDMSVMYKVTKRIPGTVTIISRNNVKGYASYWDGTKFVDFKVNTVSFDTHVKVWTDSSADVADKVVAFSVICDAGA